MVYEFLLFKSNKKIDKYTWRDYTTKIWLDLVKVDFNKLLQIISISLSKSSLFKVILKNKERKYEVKNYTRAGKSRFLMFLPKIIENPPPGTTLSSSALQSTGEAFLECIRWNHRSDGVSKLPCFSEDMHIFPLPPTPPPSSFHPCPRPSGVRMCVCVCARWVSKGEGWSWGGGKQSLNENAHTHTHTVGRCSVPIFPGFVFFLRCCTPHSLQFFSLHIWPIRESPTLAHRMQGRRRRRRCPGSERSSSSHWKKKHERNFRTFASTLRWKGIIKQKNCLHRDKRRGRVWGQNMHVSTGNVD